jgi:hypothetical protein
VTNIGQTDIEGISAYSYIIGGYRGHDHIVNSSWIYNIIPVQSVPITTHVVSSNHAHVEVYLIQHYVIKFVSDFRQVGGFLRFPPPIKLIATI